MTIGPGDEPPLHVRSRESEWFYGLDGRATFYVGDREYAGGPGAFVALPRGIPHTFAVDTPTARLMLLNAPGGFERMLSSRRRRRTLLSTRCGSTESRSWARIPANSDVEGTRAQRDGERMERRAVNPWTWQDGFGFAQAIHVTGAGRALYCAGQTSVDDQGRPIHAGNMAAQVGQALDNLETVLAAAGFSLRDVVRLNYYTTDVDALLGAYRTLVTRLAAAGCQAASTLCGVTRLALPGLLIEIEATAMQ